MGLTTAWLTLLVVVQTLALIIVWRFAVRTEQGQLIDTIALTGSRLGRDRIAGPVGTVLNAVSVLSLLAATVFVGFIALIRRRIILALLATGLIAGANVITQLLKYGLQRPDLGVDPERAAAGNSLPSGHATVAASVAVALVLVLPPRLRGWAAILGTAYAAAVGVATLSAGWHRPSDAVAAYLIVGAGAAVAGIVLLLTRPERAWIAPTDAPRAALAVLGLAGLALLVAAAVGLAWTDSVRYTPVTELGRRGLFAAYAGAAAGVAGTASLMMAMVLVTVHRVVPRHAEPAEPVTGS
jgi:membrane-associated phospholipid phosphatase